MKKLTSIACALLMMSVASTAVFGGNRFDYQAGGTIDRVDFRNGVIIIDDWLYKLSPNLQIRDKRNNVAGRKHLKVGKKVGINTYGSGSDLYVHELRILPDDFDLERALDENDR